MKKITFFDIMTYIISGLLVLIVAYPLVLVLSNSVSDPSLVAQGKVVFLPKGLNLKGYIHIFNDPDILTGYANTIFYTVVGTLINLLVTVPCGYVLARQNLPGKKIFMTFFMITMYFSGGLIPTFLVVRDLGLYNSRWALLLLGAFSMYNCIICRSFFAGLPKELEEAACIDGCSDIGTFVKIVLPLSKALMGVMVLYFALGHWNAYFNAMIYLQDSAKWPLQVFLRGILIEAQSQIKQGEEILGDAVELENLIRYGIIVVSSLPLLIIYPFLQKYFDKGVLIGSVKG